MSPMPSLPVSSVRAWHISRACARDSRAQGPAISASGRSLPMVILPTVTWRVAVMAHPGWADLARSICRLQGLADVEEQFALPAGIIQRYMAMGRLAKPFRRHAALCRIPVVAQAECRVSQRLDVDSAMAERRLADEADLIPIDEHHVEEERIGNENRPPAERLQPAIIVRHRMRRSAQVL